MCCVKNCSLLAVLHELPILSGISPSLHSYFFAWSTDRYNLMYYVEVTEGETCYLGKVLPTQKLFVSYFAICFHPSSCALLYVFANHTHMEQHRKYL